MMYTLNISQFCLSVIPQQSWKMGGGGLNSKCLTKCLVTLSALPSKHSIHISYCYSLLPSSLAKVPCCNSPWPLGSLATPWPLTLKFSVDLKMVRLTHQRGRKHIFKRFPSHQMPPAFPRHCAYLFPILLACLQGRKASLSSFYRKGDESQWK